MSNLADQGAVGLEFRGDPGNIEVQEWAVPGDSDYQTTYLPLPYWPHAWTGGVPQTPDRDFTQSGRTFTALAAMDLQTDEELVVRYDYLEGSPTGYVAVIEPTPLAAVVTGAVGGNSLYSMSDFPPESQAGDLMVMAFQFPDGAPPTVNGPTLLADVVSGSGWTGRLYVMRDDGVANPNIAGSTGSILYTVYRGIGVTAPEVSSAGTAGLATSLNAPALAAVHDIVLRFWMTDQGHLITLPTGPLVLHNGDVGMGRQGGAVSELSTTAVGASLATNAGSARWHAFTVGLDSSG